jgi:tetratricopeptide (TPR) repeat protein
MSPQQIAKRRRADAPKRLLDSPTRMSQYARASAIQSSFRFQHFIMKTNSFISSLLVVVLLAFFAVCVSAQEQKPEPKLSEGEVKGVNAINALTDPAAKLKALEDFIKKYPKTPIRRQLADTAAAEIAKIKDPAQAVALAEAAQKIFTGDEEQQNLLGVLLDAYVEAGRTDDAFRVGSSILSKNPDEVHTHVQLAFAGANEVKKQNSKYVKPALQSSIKAIALIEADKKPATMDAANWANHKALLPQLYHQAAFLNFVEGNLTDATTQANKATTLKPTDPQSFALLGMVINQDYLKSAESYKTMPEGADKAATLKKLVGMLDQIIDAYAHAVALSNGKPEYQAMTQQLTSDLTSYYKFRHNNSTEGMQELIDKYKPKP